MISAIQFGNIFTSGDSTVIGGSATGFDTAALIEGLTEAKRLPAIQLETKFEENTEKLAAFSEMETNLRSFRESLDLLRNPPGVNNAAENIFEYRTGEVSSNTSIAGSNYLNITAEPGAEIGEYDISVDQVASANIKTTETFALADADTDAVGAGKPFNAGTLTLGPNAVDIEIEEDDTLSQIVSKINAVSDTSQVRATMLQVSDGNFRLQFRTTDTGTGMNYDLIGGTHNQSGNEIVIEAEQFTNNIARGNDEFTIANDGAASNGQYITTVDDGDVISNDIETTAAEVNYQVNFDSTGTYYIHVLGQGGGLSDTLHIGLDGVVPATGNSIDGLVDPSYVWSNSLAGGGVASLEVGTAGEHTLNLYMREDGTDIDQIILTTDAAFDPEAAPLTSTLATAHNNNSVLNFALAIEEDAVDAELTIDGTTIIRSDNSIDDLIEGVTFNLEQETPDGTELSVSIEPDLEIVRGGIISFVDAFNNFRIFQSAQTERDSDNAHTEEAILKNNPTLRSVNSALLAEASSIVGGLNVEPNRLADLGITFEDFPGDSETPETKNILVIDQAKLDSALNSNFSGVRDVFEFDFTSSNANIQVFSRNNTLDVTDFSLNLDFTGENYQATYTDANGADQTIDVDINEISGGGYTITGQTNTVLAGLTLIYSGSTDVLATLSLSQGIADRMFNAVENTVEDETGAIAVELDGLNETNNRYTDEIARIDAVVERFRQQQLQRFADLEAAISSVNTLLQSLDAQADARANG